ncbi:MAG: NUDIX domain-containing protein [Candidatus Babeliales bacterium]
MSSPVQKPIARVGVGVFVIHNEKLLLAKRINAHGEGTWSPAGGHLEFGETIEQCATRELYEETGMIAHKIRSIGWVNNVFIQEQKQYITFFTLVEEYSGEPVVKEPHKNEQWQWFALNELPATLFLPVKTFFEQHSIDARSNL